MFSLSIVFFALLPEYGFKIAIFAAINFSFTALVVGAIAVLRSIWVKKKEKPNIESEILVSVEKYHSAANKGCESKLVEATRKFHSISETGKKIATLTQQLNTMEIEKSLEAIINYLNQKHEKVIMVNQFINYLLPTIDGLYSEYLWFEQQPMKSEEVARTMCKTLEVLNSGIPTLKELYDALLESEMLSMQCDTNLLKSFIH
jgi:5-bromo-4-chloroindolyl phosphate hydrolysis protein